MESSPALPGQAHSPFCTLHSTFEIRLLEFSVTSHTASELYRSYGTFSCAYQESFFNNFSFTSLRVLALACASLRVPAWGLEACSRLPEKLPPAVCYTSADEKEIEDRESADRFSQLVLPEAREKPQGAPGTGTDRTRQPRFSGFQLFVSFISCSVIRICFGFRYSDFEF